MSADAMRGRRQLIGTAAAVWFASGLTAVAWALACGVLSKSESIDAYCEERQA
jgi:hypothetical protein